MATSFINKKVQSGGAFGSTVLIHALLYAVIFTASSSLLALKNDYPLWLWPVTFLVFFGASLLTLKFGTREVAGSDQLEVRKTGLLAFAAVSAIVIVAAVFFFYFR